MSEWTPPMDPFTTSLYDQVPLEGSVMFGPWDRENHPHGIRVARAIERLFQDHWISEYRVAWDEFHGLTVMARGRIRKPEDVPGLRWYPPKEEDWH